PAALPWSATRPDTHDSRSSSRKRVPEQSSSTAWSARRISLPGCEQGRGDRGDAVAAAGETEAVAGRPRHAHRSAHGLGQHPLGLLAASPDARAVTHDLHDGVAHDETGGLDTAPNLGEQLDPVRARPARIARAED